MHRILATWLLEKDASWLWLTQQAGMSPSSATGIKRGVIPRMETLYKIAAVTSPDLTYEDLAAAAGYIDEPGGTGHKPESVSGSNISEPNAEDFSQRYDKLLPELKAKLDGLFAMRGFRNTEAMQRDLIRYLDFLESEINE